MLGISGFGLFHTLISVIALAAGALCLARRREIAWAWRSGRIYVLLTVASCVTGFFIFHHGGFGKPHALGIVTLLVLGLAVFAERRRVGIWRYVSAVAYSLTFFFHFIPGFTETLTRVPAARPWASGPDDPRLAMLIGVVFALFLVGATAQVLRIRAQRAGSPLAGAHPPQA